MSMNDGWTFRMKAAQRDLIAACGGIKSVEESFNYGKSTVGRWNDGGDPTMMPIPAVRALEADCGIPFVTSVLAEVTGRRLTDPDTERAAEVCVMQTHARVMHQMAELATGMAVAIADGQVTPMEATSVDRVAADIQTAMNDLRSALASIKARGGVKAGLRVVGDE